MPPATFSRPAPQLILATLVLVCMVLGPVLIAGAGIAWLIESRQLVGFEVVESSVKSVGQTASDPTIVQFSFHQLTVTSRLAETYTRTNLKPGDSLTVLFDGNSLPIPNDYLAKHMFSTLLGIAAFTCLATLCLMKVFRHRLLGPNPDLRQFVADQYKVWLGQLGMEPQSR